MNQEAKAQGSGGPYEKKWLILSILDGEKLHRAVKEPLGRVVINLADYAAEDDKATMSFTVASNNTVSHDIGECKLLITLGCRSKGKPPMVLGGRSFQRTTSADRGSVASSEYSEDEDSDGDNYGPPAAIQPMVKPLDRIAEGGNGDRKVSRNELYDEDGFLVDEDEEEEGKYQRQKPPLASRASRSSAKSREPDSDQDSEDEFLAQAVAAMESKAPVPVAPRQAQQSRGGVPRATVTGVPSIGPTISAQADPRVAPNSPFNPHAAPPGKGGLPKPPLFALRPEGKPESTPEFPSFNQNSRSKEAHGEPHGPDTGGSKRNAAGKQDGGLPRRVSKLVSQFEPIQEAEPPARSSLQGRPSTSGRSTGYRGGSPHGSPRRNRRRASQEEDDEEEDATHDLVQDRLSKGASQRYLAGERNTTQGNSNSPRRRKLAATRQETRQGDDESNRSLGVVLPTGSVSISRRPVVSLPVDNTPEPDSPIKTSAPGRHWLDEPEDLGVESSPLASPDASPPKPSSPRAAYKEVEPAPISQSVINQRLSFKSLASGGTMAPGSRQDLRSGLSTPSVGSQGSPLSSPSTNPFLSAHPDVAMQERGRASIGAGAPSDVQHQARGIAPVRQSVPPPPQAQTKQVQQHPAPQAPPQQTPVQQQQHAHSPNPFLSPSNGSIYGMGNGGSAQDVEIYTRELRAVAALEASVYLVRSGKSRGVRATSKARNVHAPARRLARTTISLGPEEGIIFGLRAIRAIEAAADGAGDISTQAYWWSNCIQLRWMLWAMCHGGDPGEDGDPDADPNSQEFDWVMQVLVPPLRELESHIFQQLFNHMWSFVLMEGATADQLPGAQAKHWNIQPSKEEEAVQRWIDAFQTVHRALLPAAKSVTAGHVSLLKHKTLTALMRRLDATLFDRLLNGGDSSGTMNRGAFSSQWKGKKGIDSDIDLPLDDRTLPFAAGGKLTFSIGVNLKMAATRWTNWAADIGLRNDKGSPEEGYMLFPKLRATADLLMMPKEVLTDRAIRLEVVPGLPLRIICELLSRFQPDDLARDPLPPGLLEALQNETPTDRDEGSPSPTSRGLTGYEPPSEAALLADGLIEPVNLEMDNDSEEELESLAEMYDPDRQGHTTERFGLLRDLWASAR